jgi:hypothetical protein
MFRSSIGAKVQHPEAQNRVFMEDNRFEMKGAAIEFNDTLK